MPPGVFALRSCGFASSRVGEIYGPVAIAGGSDAEKHSDLIHADSVLGAFGVDCLLDILSGYEYSYTYCRRAGDVCVCVCVCVRAHAR